MSLWWRSCVSVEREAHQAGRAGSLAAGERPGEAAAAADNTARQVEGRKAARAAVAAGDG